MKSRKPVRRSNVSTEDRRSNVSTEENTTSLNSASAKLNRESPGAGARDDRWWLADTPEERAENMMRVAKRTRQTQGDKISMYLHFARLYLGYNVQGLDPVTYMEEPDPLDSEPMSENVVRSIIKAAMPRVCRGAAKPMVLTEAGKWNDRNRARKLERVISGDFERCGVYDMWRTMCRDGAVWGTAAIYVYELDEAPAYERVYPWQLVVDQREGYYGRPRSIARWARVDRLVLSNLYPAKAIDIMAASVERFDNDALEAYPHESADQLLVWQAWHLPSCKGAGDGRYVCGVANDILLADEPYEHDSFPFVVFRWDQPLIGYWGEGIAREIAGHQYEIAALTRAMRQGIRSAVTRTYVPRGSEVMLSDLDDRVGTMIEFSGNQVPITVVPQAFSADWASWLKQTTEGAFRQAGVSQLSAASQKPAGLNSGAALMKYDDIEDTRHLAAAQTAEQCIVDLAKLTVRIRKEIGGGKGLSAWDAGKSIYRSIDWDEVDLDEDVYTVRVYPVSSLPSTVAGKTEIVEQWFQSGVIDADQRRQLIDVPDTEEFQQLHNAPVDYVWQQVERMLCDGKPQRPDPTVSMSTAIKTGRLAYCAALRDGCPDENLQLLRDYLDEAVSRINQPPRWQTAAELAAAQQQASPTPPPPQQP